MTQRTVLIVIADAALRASLTSALEGRGLKVLGAESFGEGRQRLVDAQPDVLVTTIRLQEHNGLHLAIVAQLASVLTKTIVIGYADPVLEAEARQAGALYLIDPDVDQVAAATEGAVRRTERRWPRTRTNIVARAADLPVQLVDLSYGGFRIEMAPGVALPAAQEFELAVGGLRIAALPVWMKQQEATARMWCGATVAEQGEGYVAWRGLVDSAMGHAMQ